MLIISTAAPSWREARVSATSAAVDESFRNMHRTINLDPRHGVRVVEAFLHRDRTSRVTVGLPARHPKVVQQTELMLLQTTVQ